MPPTPAPHGITSPGRPLPIELRAPLERAYGYDLQRIRLHDAPADRSQARALGALAFASGAHIVHAGRGTVPEAHVLAHEVAHVLQSAIEPASPAVQRYESAEHQDLGDTALDDLLDFLQTEDGVRWAQARKLDAAALVRQIKADPLKAAGGKIIAGWRKTGEGGAPQPVGLTPGQVVALSGDLYGSPDAIGAAAAKPLAKKGDKNEIDKLEEAIDKERKGQLGDSNLAYQNITEGRYLKLAEINDTHFAPLNRVEWRRLHAQALNEAATAKGNEAALQHALLVDAAGGHFLTDAYAAGHLFKKNELVAAIHMHLAKQPLRTENPEVQAYAALVTATGDAEQLVVKAIHDRMNHLGFDISNARGMSWRTFGDTQLAKAPETRRIAGLALFLSRQQVYAAQRGEKPDPNEVQDLMPDDTTVQRATDQAIASIPTAAAEVQGVMYRGRSLVPSKIFWPLGPIAESNLATIANPGREKQLLDLQQVGRTTGAGPIVAPQFTLFDF